MRLGMALIGGGGSSGTHLLGRTLHNISNIRIGPEAHITHQEGLYDPKTFRRTLYKCLSGEGHSITFDMENGSSYQILPPYVFENRKFYGFETIDDIYDLYENSLTFLDFVNLIRNRVSRVRNWPSDFLWVEHSPRNGVCAQLFLVTHQDTKFIHLVRDGRDAVLSMTKRFRLERFPGISLEQAISLSTELWCLCQTGALLAQNEAGYIRIYYEDFVREPIYWINQVLGHLKYAPIDEEQLELSESVSTEDVGFTKAPTWGNDPLAAINTRSVGRWKSELDDSTLKYINNLSFSFSMFDRTLQFGELQSLFGYK